MEVARNVLLTFSRPGQDGRFRGSGFHLCKNLVLTADHCADGRDYQVWRSDKEMPGQVVWRSGDAHVDLALLEVDGLPEVEPVALAVLDTAAGGVLENCGCGCYPSFGRLDPPARGGLSGPDRLVPLTGNLLLDSAHVARIPDGGVRDGRVALSLTSDRSLLPDTRGTEEEVTQAWSAASGGAVLVTVGGRRFCVGVISARQVKEAPTTLRVAGFDLLTRLDPEFAAEFWDRVGVSGVAGLMTVGGTAQAAQVIVGQIPRRAPGYVERDVTAELVERVTGSGTVSLVSFAGLRGVGKSQAAGDVARHCVRQDWPLVAWVNAETHELALSDLRLLAERLGAVVQGELPEDSVRRLYSWWASDRNVRRLVVFDNLVDRRDVDGLVPPEGSAAVIATTANRSIAIGDVVDVGAFSREQAIAYLEDGTALADPDGAGRVASELSRLPLALAGAVWTIARRRRLDHSYSYDRYLEALELQSLSSVLGGDKATPEYPRATVAALSMAVEAAVDAAENRELARSVLGALAFLDPSGVPRHWFDVLSERFDVDDVLVVIADSGLAQPSDDTTSVIMHRLVGRVIRSESKRDSWSAQATAAATALVGAIRPLDREGYWVQRTEAVAQAAHILALLTNHNLVVDEQVIDAGLRAGKALIILSDPHTALTVLSPVSATAERVLGADHPTTLTSRSDLALGYASAGDQMRAIPLDEATLADRERILGIGHPDTLSSRRHLAHGHLYAGDPSRAIHLYEATLATAELVLGTDHPDTLASRFDLASAYELTGDPERAKPLFRSALAGWDRVLPTDRPEALTSRILARGHSATGNMGRAIKLYEAALAEAEQVYGADHPATLASRGELAAVYAAANDWDRAMPLYETTLADSERVLGRDHPSTLNSRLNLANGCLGAGDPRRAIHLYEAALADAERLLGNDSRDTITVRHNLASTYESAGDLERAIPLYEAALADAERLLGTDHRETRGFRISLACACHEAGDLSRAQSLFEGT